MTPPVARDPSLRVPGSHLLLVAGVVLVTSIVLGGVQHALVSDDTDIVYSPVSMLLAIVTYCTWGAAVLWAAAQTGDARRALGLVRAAVVAALARPGESSRSSRRSPSAPSWSRSCTPHAAGPGARTRRDPRSRIARGRGPGGRRHRPRRAARRGAVLPRAADRGFRRRCGPIGTALLTAALFALAHLLPTRIPPLFLLGLALALVYERVGSTVPGIMVHCVYNGIAWPPP